MRNNTHKKSVLYILKYLNVLKQSFFMVIDRDCMYTGTKELAMLRSVKKIQAVWSYQDY